jgi:isopentenyl-diphosphate Delta-isomerase
MVFYMNEFVILVDKDDNEIGKEEKLEAHKKGLLHRAFSIFVFNDKEELLLQRRAFDKYHSGGLWTNTCCSHPRPGEDLVSAVHRRLREEMGFDCNLHEINRFLYRAEFLNGLIENELDHVFVGEFCGEVNPDESEVAEHRWVNMEQVEKDVVLNPEAYSYWFRYALSNRLLGGGVIL